MVNKPAADKIEVIKIATIQTGAIHLVITTNIFSERKRDDSFTSSTATLVPTMNPKKIHVNNAEIGIKMLFVKKSKNSEMFIPNRVNPFHQPNPHAAPSPITIEPKHVPIQVGIRFHPNWS